MDFLNIPGYVTMGVEQRSDEYVIEAQALSAKTSCPHCQAPLQRQINRGHWKQSFVDVPRNGKRVLVNVDRRAFYCNDCRRFHYQRIPHLNSRRRLTERCIEYIRYEAFNRRIVSIGRDIGISPPQIRDVLFEFISQMEKTRRPNGSKWLAIDEVIICGQPRCILANVRKRELIELQPRLDRVLVTAYLDELPKKEMVRAVTTDMWNPAREIVRSYFPNALHIVDRIHVMRLVDSVLRSVEGKSLSVLPNKLKKQLMSCRFQLYKRRRELSHFECLRLEKWAEHMPVLRMAYDYKESLYDIWDGSGNPEEARSGYCEWEARLPARMSAVFRPIKTMMDQWEPEILAYFTMRDRKAYASCLDEIGRSANQLGPHYEFDLFRAKILYSDFLHR